MKGFKKYLFQYKKGDTIYAKGEAQSNFFIINKGKVQLKNDDLILTSLTKGDFFGEESLNENQKAVCTIEVIDDSDILKIPYPSLIEMMKQNNDISLKILKKLSEKQIKIMENILKYHVAMSKEMAEVSKPEEKEKAAEQKDDSTSEKLNPDIKAYLIIQRSNRIVQLSKLTTYLGRRDYTTGFTPDIDLTEEDEEKYISRKHAGISYINNKFYVSEEPGAVNGTFLNGEKLKTGVKYEIKNEDELTLCHLSMIFKY
jgi:CRP-like cAMP-binding protein